DYYRIIEMKTAALFAAATELGAFINEAAPEVISAMKTFGLKLGTAYQIYDDCLDLAGSELNAGKTLGSDLRKGKLTLPILHLLQHASADERHFLSEQILGGEDVDITALTQAAREKGSLRSAMRVSKKLLGEASQQLESLPANKYRSGLRGVCESVAELLAPFGN
ncbi:MAG: octaprenyl-diphosphate synthase, partial [Chthoniobacter sp.]|nr:octaprenyl-diphosphate synthase [Chthoniobacter sp.]